MSSCVYTLYNKKNTGHGNLCISARHPAILKPVLMAGYHVGYRRTDFCKAAMYSFVALGIII
jgi:hypothetical protein